jgi:hypothetical protein
VTEATVAAAAQQIADRSLIVPPQDSSAVRAQRFVRSVLAESDIERDVVDLAVLMTKALVINGILHARSALAVTIKLLPDSIRIEVADRDQLLQGSAQSWGMATIARSS